MTDKHTPPADALYFSVYGFECALSLHEIFTDNKGLKCVALVNDVWQYIAEPDTYASAITTKEKTDAWFETAIAQINGALEVALGGGTPADEPESGFERIQWLIDNKLYVEDNKLKIKE